MKLESLVVVLGLALVGCSSHPTAEEAGRKFGQALCEKLESCFPSEFSAAYGSINACVEKGLSAIPEDQRDSKDACTDDEVDECVDDTKSLACPSTVSGLKLPASCEGC